MSTEGGTRAVVAALLANVGIAIAKFIGFLVTRSSSMLAESIHSVADSANQVLLLVGGKRSRRDADEAHQFGYGRERYFWAFVVAIVLFLLGGVFAVFEGVEKVLHPHDVESPGWAIGILLAAMVMEGFSFRTAVHEARPLKPNQSWFAFIRKTKSPELPVVLLEDFGALIGLVIALGAVGLTTITGNADFDGIGTIMIGLLLVIIAIVLAREMKSLLIGEAASEADIDAMTKAIVAAPYVERLLNLRSEHIGPEELLVAAKIEFSHDLTVPQLADAIDEVEVRVRAAVPIARRLFIEPDIHRAARASGVDRTP
jgi:cation diffusion facilitator family transporter